MSFEQSIVIGKVGTIPELSMSGFGFNFSFDSVYSISIILFIIVLIEIIKLGKVLKEENELRI
ncbi:hypothetical protein ACQPU1_06950 [Clostridium paraputrificum]|uniref:hypothetical protein n=1 Tax=Clostridium TaxID=1485 RepID=UPI003D34BB37